MCADIYSLQGLSQLYSTIGKVQRFCKVNIKIAGLLLTRYNGRAILNRDIREAIEVKAAELQAPIYKTYIREAIAVKEAQTQQQSIFEYAPSATAAIDYMEFVDEYIAQEKGEWF
jgi:chromosome partitioning protein